MTSLIQVLMIQMKYRERFLGQVKSGKKGGLVGYSLEQDSHWFLGTSSTRGRLCISPALSDFIADRQHSEAMIYKERRKLAEERRLLKGGKEEAEE